MSLISIRHFISPLQNKTNLFAIIGIVVLFTAFRMAGGGTYTNYTNSKQAHQERINSDFDIPTFDDSGSSNSDIPARTVPRDNDPINDILKDDSGAYESQALEQSEEGGLADIERQLGLR